MGSVFLLTLAASAFQTPLPAAGQAAAAPQNGDERVVCRRESSVGTRLATRTCMTRAQWREHEQLQREAARRQVDRASDLGAMPNAGDPSGAGSLAGQNSLPQ